MTESRDTKKPLRLPLLPLRDVIVLPHMIIPLFVGREKSIGAINESMSGDKNIVLATQKKASVDQPGPGDIYHTGTLAEILQILKLPDGTVKILVEGTSRIKIDSIEETGDMLMATGEPIVVPPLKNRRIEAMMRTIYSQFERYVKLSKKVPQEILISMNNIEDPDKLADTTIANMDLKIAEKQSLLETTDIVERLEKLLKLLNAEIEILQVERKIQGKVKKEMEKTQKEYYLMEQMKAIQKELGKKDEFTSEMDELRQQIKDAKMTKEANEKATRELKKLEMMPPMSAEATVVRNYLDWLISVPWSKTTKDKLNIDEAKKILDEDHYGLEKVKERILEYLAVTTLVKKIKGPILCLVGPPGVGKTSLAKSIARAMGRKFVRLSLGGVRDEAEIRGHRRTYIGALPGRIIQSMKKAGSRNPVFLLDEVDKIGMDFRGDPAAALLEVLDPEQNNTFNDHYLEVDFDLSEVLFVTTANTNYSIPPALLDRMETISLPGYTEDEKLKIAQLFLVPKQREANGLSVRNITFSENSIKEIIQRYTREAGVRNLEREIASISRKVAKEVVKKGKKTQVRITPKGIHKYLGPPRFKYGKAEKKDETGSATGLAWTEVGGDILTTEVTIMPGRGKLFLTGKLGEVMRESARAALSYIRSRAKVFDLPTDFHQKVDIHIHLPEGAIPKDGPSAGITMATAMVSALTGVPVRRDVAMTGEITLRGRVLPIGGVKSKVLAAHRGGISTIIIPSENEKDLKDIPANIRKAVTFVMVENMDQVLMEALKGFEMGEMPEGGYPLSEIMAYRKPKPPKEPKEGIPTPSH
jgi:ATP-dependent Lon protease